ncbi:uncharacterized protein BO66DRAFT_437333 [Aspergillus aculeatinus CBS 121060]|uniref:Uncharacterized protein n=1 Tax=Aspergillus aculeatinus CBS 121060 TaxID=1448322 RepID=A0ACD1HCZ9_9EURO|nr:hypothetical protein BO66DRAFT_437333 [Aspergillus aculeatinus CBS 121060]RAH71309.1 hypothetical protein BO66DRAFT_437333 [Aspergillus aculeatinus CBS 121060]
MNDQFSVVVTQLRSRGKVNDFELESLCRECLSESRNLEQILSNLRDNGNKFKKFFAIWWAEGKITDLKTKLEKYESRLNLLISVRVSDSVKTIKERTAEILKYTQFCNGLDERTTAIEQKVDENTIAIQKGFKELTADVAPIRVDRFVLEQLAYAGMGSWYMRVDTAYTQTLEWLVDEAVMPCKENQTWCEETRKEFVHWLKKGQGIFHITGKPGSGKSTLMKFLCESPHPRKHLDAWAGQKSLVVARYFIGNGKPPPSEQDANNEHNRQGLIRGLLHSILTRAPEFTPAIFPELSEGKLPPLSDNGFEKAVEKLQQKNNIYDDHKLVIFIDGLDEFKGDRIRLCDNLMDWASHMPADVKICVSSREEVQFEKRHRLSGTFRLQDVNYTDISRFVRGRLNGHTCYRNWSDHDRLDLETCIVRKAEGVFLWSRLIMGELERDIDGDARLDDLKSRVKELHGELPDLFQHIITSILKSRSRYAFALMKMVLVASLPWSLSLFSFLEKYLEDPNFAYTLRLDTEVEGEEKLLARLERTKAHINRRCRGLLEVSHRQVTRKTTVAFAHRSIPEFLIQEPTFTQYQAFPDGCDVLDALSQILLADLTCRATYSRLQRRTLKQWRQPVMLSRSTREVSCKTTLPYAIEDFSLYIPCQEFWTDVRNVHQLLKALGRLDQTPRRSERIARFLITVARAIEHTLPSEFDFRLIFWRKPSPVPVPDPVLNPGEKDPEASVSVEVLSQILAACNGIIWPEGLDVLGQKIPFNTLAYNAIIATQAEDSHLTWGLIATLKTFLSRGFSLDSPADLDDAVNLSHWECFLAEALAYTPDFLKLRRLFPLFHLFLLCGGDPRLNFKIRLEAQSSRAQRQSNPSRGALGLVAGASEESKENWYHFRQPKPVATLGALRDRLRDEFSLEEIFRLLVPREEAPTLHELVALRLADLSPQEQASRIAELKPRVERMLTVEAIKEALRL